MAILQQVWLPLLISGVAAYLLGSLNFGIIVTKLIVGEDIREKGSGNAGATNVLRSHGKGLALLTTLGDLGKCFAAVLLARLVFFPAFGCEAFAGYGAYIAGFCCIIGHLYPLYFGFRGGKGVMTTFGMMLVLDWQIALVCLGLFIVLMLIWRMVSLGSIMAAALLPIATFVKMKYIAPVETTEELIFCTVMTVLIGAILIVKHKANIKRIMNGTEHKFGSKKK